MLIILIAVGSVLAVFLFGVLVIASLVTMRHGDPSACFKLYKVRDDLIDAVVFKGVPRDNPWLESIYENVNSILVHSNLIGGPKGWPLAIAVGSYQASHPNSGKKLMPFPKELACPEPLRNISGELKDALEYLSRNHFGLELQVSAREREQRRIQKEKAKNFLSMMEQSPGCFSLH